MKFAIILFDGNTEVVEARSQKKALEKAKLDGENKWMVTDVSIAMKEARPYSESFLDHMCELDHNVIFVNPTIPVDLDSYAAMGLT